MMKPQSTPNAMTMLQRKPPCNPKSQYIALDEDRCWKKIKQSETKQAASPLAQWIDDNCAHEQSHCNANGDLNHGGSDVKYHGIQRFSLADPDSARTIDNSCRVDELVGCTKTTQ
jgi:hypothetical protein